MDASFCVDCLQEAIANFGKPEIFNSNQGSQFTSDAVTGVLIENGITISMDGRGRALDNIFCRALMAHCEIRKYFFEKIRRPASLLLWLTEYFMFYNEVRQP